MHRLIYKECYYVQRDFHYFDSVSLSDLMNIDYESRQLQTTLDKELLLDKETQFGCCWSDRHIRGCSNIISSSDRVCTSLDLILRILRRLLISHRVFSQSGIYFAGILIVVCSQNGSRWSSDSRIQIQRTLQQLQQLDYSDNFHIILARSTLRQARFVSMFCCLWAGCINFNTRLKFLFIY